MIGLPLLMVWMKLKVDSYEFVIETYGIIKDFEGLQSIVKTFGIHDYILPRPEMGGDIQETVNKINRIAHGNKHQKVRREVSVFNLQRKLVEILETCTYSCDL